MNKKFSTLMAGLMLASAFSVADAQNLVQKYETSKTYWLGIDGTPNDNKVEEVIAVVSDPKDTNYGRLVLVPIGNLNDIHAVKAATWTIAFTQPTDGTAPKFTYVNKATGLTLSLDADEAKKYAKDAQKNGTVEAFVKGSASEFLNTDITDAGSKKKLGFAVLRSYYDANDAIYLTKKTNATLVNYDFGSGKVAAYPLYLKVMENATTTGLAGDNEAVQVAPAQPSIFPLTANDLNSQLGKLDLDVVSDDQAWFNLYFNQDVTDDAAKNLFSATKLKAVQVTADRLRKGDDLDTEKPVVDNWEADPNNAGYEKVTVNTPYVKLLSDDKESYIVVDTAYHTGTETIGKLPKFTYAKSTYEGTNNVKRNENSFQFAFAYNPYTDEILIKSRGYYTRTRTMSQTPNKISGTVDDAGKVNVTYDGNEAYTRWGFNLENDGTIDWTNVAEVSDAYVRLAKLGSVRELTVAEEITSDKVYTADNRDDDGGYNVANKAVWSTSSSAIWAEKGMGTSVKASQNDLTFSPTSVADGLYLIKLHTSGYDELGNKRSEADGDYLIASLAGNFGYAEQAKNQNYDHMPAAQWYVEKQGTSTTAPIKIINREFLDQKAGNYFGKDGAQIQLFNAGDGKVFFTVNASTFANDTLEFIPVSAESKKDSKLGYKYVDEKQASVETYYFNYLHGLALDKGLNTPSDKDSLVRVDETGDKIALRLIPVVKDDSYGVQLDEKKTGIANLVRNAYYIEAYDNLKFAADGRSRYLTYDEASKKYVMSLVPMPFFLKENNCIDNTPYYALVQANLYGYLYKNTWSNASMNVLKSQMYPAAFKGMNIVDDATKVWSYEELTQKEKSVIVDGMEVKLGNVLSPSQREKVKVVFYDKDGEPIISDASEAIDLYAYIANANQKTITLTRVKTGGNGTETVYYAMNPDVELNQGSAFGSGESKSWNYANSRISVDDNTLDLFIAELGNNTTDWYVELRVSAFEAQVNDSPLYRRFNGANGEYGTEANAPLNLKFFRHNNNAEYLFENYASENEYRDGINDKEISFLGVNNAFQFPESETRSYTMFVDTAYVRANTRMPQYLIGIRPEVVEGDTTLCDASTHQHATPEEALACEHSKINVGFTRAMYLFNAQDSVDVKNYDYQGKAAYGAQGYTRLAFKDAVHANDTLYILNPNVTTEELKACNLKNDKLFAKKIALDNNKHKNVVFQFRLVTDEDNRFLIESEAEENGKAVFNKDLKNVSVAPMRGGWVKIQNGVPVIARFDDFNEAIAQAEIFDVNDEIKYDATANDEIAVEGVTVVAGNGQVTIMGAAGKNVTITNILGKVIASQVIASDNATIAVPAGIVAVAVEGEAAVKAIVK